MSGKRTLNKGSNNKSKTKKSRNDEDGEGNDVNRNKLHLEEDEDKSDIEASSSSSSSENSSDEDNSSSSSESSDNENVEKQQTNVTSSTTDSSTKDPLTIVSDSIASQLAMLQLPPDPSILENDVSTLIPDFIDGYDANYMGDDDDRQRLASMNELDRETELGLRSEKRREGSQQVSILRNFLSSLKDQYVREKTALLKKTRGTPGNKARTTINDDDDDSDIQIGGKGRRGRKKAIPGRKSVKKVTKKKVLSDSENEKEKSSSESESDSSSASSSSASSSDADSSSESDSSSDDDSDAASESSEEREVGGRRLRKTVARARAAQRRGSSDDEEGEFSSMVKLRGKNKKVADSKKRAERNRARYGNSDSEGEEDEDDYDDGEGITTNVNDLKKGIRSSGKSSSSRGNYANYYDDDDDDFVDEGIENHVLSTIQSSTPLTPGQRGGDNRTPRSTGGKTATPHVSIPKALRDILSDKSNLLHEATAADINANVRLTRSQAQRLLSHPHFKEIVVDCYVKFPQAIPNPNDPAVREALQKGTISRYRVGRIVEVGHSGRYYDPYQPDEKLKQSLKDEEEGLSGGIFGTVGKSLLKAKSADMVRNTDLVFVIAIGSNRSTISPTNKMVPRIVRIKDISNHTITDLEWKAYTDRLRANHANSHLNEDLVPIREILVSKATVARALQENPNYTREQTEKTLRERTRHTFTGESIKLVINPTFSRTLASEKLESLQRQLKNLDPTAAGVEAQHKVLERECQEQSRIIQEIDREEERRRDEARKLAERRLREKKQVSALSSVVNMELTNANRERMRAAADIERVKDDKAAQAEINENPFMRRRTIPSNLFNVKGGKALEADKNNTGTTEEKKTTEKADDKKPTSAATVDAPVRNTSLHLHDEIDAGDIQSHNDHSHLDDLDMEIGITTLSSSSSNLASSSTITTSLSSYSTSSPTVPVSGGMSLAAFRAKMNAK